MNVVVTDTGPLQHLHQAGAIHLLAHLGNIQLTPTVWNELQRHAPSFATSGLPAWLSLAQPSTSAMLQASQWVNAQVLHAGEAEALAHAPDTQADQFLTDDTAARTLGASLGIQVAARWASCFSLPRPVIWTRRRVCRLSMIWKRNRRFGCRGTLSRQRGRRSLRFSARRKWGYTTHPSNPSRQKQQEGGIVVGFNLQSAGPRRPPVCMNEAWMNAPLSGASELWRGPPKALN